MAQDVQIIDLRRSYVPIDPNAFPVTMLDATGEDSPETRVPTIPYNGYNFMPTPQGYSSFFGINVNLGISTLIASGGSGNVDDIFMIQTLTLDNILVALCDDGIWTKSATASGVWTHAIVLSVPASGTHLNWSKCVLENEVFVYRQGATGHFKATPTNLYVFTIEIPTFLNMTGQLGIFKAGGRLGYWDSENSISWSNLGVTQDFLPDLETLAGNTVFQDIVGKIVIVIQHGTGFIIYATKSIVSVTRNVGSPMLWQGKGLFNNNGISYREEVCLSEPDIVHFAITTQGLIQVTGSPTTGGGLSSQAEFISPEVITFLKEKRQPVFLKMINGRYLFFCMLDPYYITGQIAFSIENIPGNNLEFRGAVITIDGFTSDNGNAGKAMIAVEKSFQTYYINKNLGLTALTQANVVGSVPIWDDNLSFIIPKADLAVFKTYVDANNIGAYFTDTGFTQGAVTKITGGSEFFIPTKGPQLTAAFLPVIHVEANANDFWNSQDMIWFYERLFMQGWLDAINNKAHGTFTSVSPSMVDTIASTASSAVIPRRFGPYIDMSYFSESNKYYGSAVKSAWLQRSLTKGVYVDIDEIITNPGGVVEAQWTNGGNTWGQPIFATYAAAIAGGPAVVAAYNAFFATALVFSHIVEHAGTAVATEFRRIDYFITQAGGTLLATWYAANALGAASDTAIGGPYLLGVGKAVYLVNSGRTQSFGSHSNFVYTDFLPCTYKELGFTKIKGHGHYTILGAFIVDDAVGELVDYVDQCGLPTVPKRKRLPVFQGVTIGTNGFPGFGLPVTINAVTYTFPSYSVTIPSGSILLQAGSIEPIYPTFLGAFVFDTHYKKWGKQAGNFKRLLDYFPINDVAGEGIVPFDAFLPRASMLAENGLIYLFDQFPSDSYLTYGKVGFYRKGFTQSEEVRIINRSPMNGTVVIEGSLTSGDIDPSISISRPYAAAKEFTAYCSGSARWYNIQVEGNYDLIALEFRGHRTGRR